MNTLINQQQCYATTYLSTMRDQQSALLLVFLLLLASSCKKDGDSSPPTVRIVLPSSGTVLSVPESLVVRLEVHDNRTVKRVTVLLSDQNGAPITASASAEVNAASSMVELSLVVASERIHSGTYTLTAIASDGDNEGRDHLPLTIQGAPLRLRSLFVLPLGTSSPPYSITRIDSTGTIGSWASLPELGGAAIDPDRLFTAGTLSQPVSRLNVNTGASQIMFANQNAGGNTEPYFLGLVRDPSDDRIYFGTRDGSIRGFSSSGSQTFTGQSPTGFRSEITVVNSGKMVSMAYRPVTNERVMVTHAYASGALLGQWPSDILPLGLCRLAADQVLVFGNRNGDGIVQNRNTAQGGTFEVRSFPGDAIRAVVRIDVNTFVIALESGLVRFNYSSNSISFLSATSAQALAYETATGSLYAGSNDQLIYLDPSTGTITNTRTMPTEIGYILPLLNR